MTEILAFCRTLARSNGSRAVLRSLFSGSTNDLTSACVVKCCPNMMDKSKPEHTSTILVDLTLEMHSKARTYVSPVQPELAVASASVVCICRINYATSQGPLQRQALLSLNKPAHRRKCNAHLFASSSSQWIRLLHKLRVSRVRR